MFDRKMKKRLKKAEAEIEGLHLTLEIFNKKLESKLRPTAKLDLDAFPDNMAETKKFKDIVVKSNCPACGHKKLLLDAFTRTPIGYEAQVHCENCDFTGRINSDGFHLEGMHGLGRAKAK